MRNGDHHKSCFLGALQARKWQLFEKMHLGLQLSIISQMWLPQNYSCMWSLRAITCLAIVISRAMLHGRLPRWDRCSSTSASTLLSLSGISLRRLQPFQLDSSQLLLVHFLLGTSQRPPQGLFQWIPNPERRSLPLFLPLSWLFVLCMPSWWLAIPCTITLAYDVFSPQLLALLSSLSTFPHNVCQQGIGPNWFACISFVMHVEKVRFAILSGMLMLCQNLFCLWTAASFTTSRYTWHDLC